MKNIYVGLGSNIEPRKKYLQAALKELEEGGKVSVIERSSIYRTKPVGYLDQNDFFNAVVELETELSPRQLLNYLNQIERDLGRTRDIHWGPRTIDLDILIYGDIKIKSKDLKIPHPRLTERLFVLVPLLEIAGNITVEGRGIEEFINNLDVKDDDIEKIGQPEELAR